MAKNERVKQIIYNRNESRSPTNLESEQNKNKFPYILGAYRQR